MSIGQRIGKTAYIRYKGGALGEEILDEHMDEPLAVKIGNMEIPPGIEEAIVEMEIGEQRELEIPCEKGYGQYQAQHAEWYPKNMVTDGYNLKVGEVIFWTKPDDGTRMPVWVTEETEDNIKLDFNHPFAGKTLSYWVELVDVK